MGPAVAAHVGHATRVKPWEEPSTVFDPFLTLALNRHHGTRIDSTVHASAANRRTMHSARGLQGQHSNAGWSADSG